MTLQYSWPQLAAATALTYLAVFLARGVVRGYRHRKLFSKLPGPPHDPIWGHLKLMGELEKSVPYATFPQAYMHHLVKKYHITSSVCYIDLWPIADSMIVVLDPDVAQQVTMENSLKKFKGVDEFMQVLAGEGNMVSTSGPLWKKWRSIMNPGFAAAHLMTLVPGIVDDCLIFSDILQEHATTGDVFRIEDAATKLTIDIIGKVVLDKSFSNQRQEDEFIDAFRDQLRRLPIFTYTVDRFIPNPYTFYKRWANLRTMDRYIHRHLEARFSHLNEQDATQTGDKKQRKRAVIDLALESYLMQEEGLDGTKASDPQLQTMDAEFKKYATNQIKTFIFAGHDTTSSTVSYIYHLLAKNPDCLRQIRDEHDRVLGDVSQTAQRIKENPHVLNQLEYTLAVIKEELRLFPAGSTIRTGNPGFFLRDPKTGESYPTNDYMVWPIAYHLHRAPKYWGSNADTFDPSKFLPANASKLPNKVWRPFETGPRNCIGQDLALLEARIILALTIRSFDFKTAYDRLPELENDGSTYAAKKAYRRGRQDLFGEEAYQVLIATAKPREGLPMVVTKRTT